MCFTLPCGQGRHTAQFCFSFPCGHRFIPITLGECLMPRATTCARTAKRRSCSFEVTSRPAREIKAKIVAKKSQRFGTKHASARCSSQRVRTRPNARFNFSTRFHFRRPKLRTHASSASTQLSVSRAPTLRASNISDVTSLFPRIVRDKTSSFRRHHGTVPPHQSAWQGKLRHRDVGDKSGKP